MCLIALAHRASSRFPFVLAANRDEDYQRATHDAHHWTDAPDVVGGKDALYGGTWLAVRRGGRFAAVTNLRGAERKVKSRGFLVRDFVLGDVGVETYAQRIAAEADQYAGFHLIAGQAGGEVMYIAPELQTPLAPGLHAFSNAPAGEEWPKTATAIEAMRNALAITDVDALLEELMRFLATPRGTASPMSEVFIRGDRYGTRSSTVVIATEREILFAERSFAAGGVAVGDRRSFRLARNPAQERGVGLRSAAAKAAASTVSPGSARGRACHSEALPMCVSRLCTSCTPPHDQATSSAIRFSRRLPTTPFSVTSAFSTFTSMSVASTSSSSVRRSFTSSRIASSERRQFFGPRPR